MFALFTDFGERGPYVGQMKAVLAHGAPSAPILDILHDAPPWDPRRSACLLKHFTDCLPDGTVCLAVVDPGVGTERPGHAVHANGKWYVGPGNGLFEDLLRGDPGARLWELPKPDPGASVSFHGRDYFAPAALAVHAGHVPGRELPRSQWRLAQDWSEALWEFVYFDHFGNAMTGVPAGVLAGEAVLAVGGSQVGHARTFADRPIGEPFWYVNSQGLVEVAVNQGSAQDSLALQVGDPVTVKAAQSER